MLCVELNSFSYLGNFALMQGRFANYFVLFLNYMEE